MLNDCPVQRLIGTSGQGQNRAIGQPDFRFGDPLDEFEIQDHATAYPAETVIQFLFKIAQCALDRIIRLCMYGYI